MLALIDGDIIAYQAVSAATKKVDWQDGEEPQAVTDVAGAIGTARHLVNDWTRLANCTRTAVMFSGRTGANFRKHIDPIRYKAGRREKPNGYWETVDGIEAAFKCYRVEGLEADDLLGIAGTDLQRWGQAVMVSIDKDLETIPGLIFNPAKDRRVRQVTTAQADYRWMTQTLTGDQCDGYPGCPKIGPVNAQRILAASGVTLGAMWQAVVSTFQAADLTIADALLQARLARILRYTDYDRDNKEVRLWHLTKPETLSLSAVHAAPSAAEAPVQTVASTAPSSRSQVRRLASRGRAGRRSASTS